MEWYWGAAAVAVAAGAGAVVGAIATPKCDNPQTSLVCGMNNGAKAGAVIGVMVAGIAGAMMTLSEEQRSTGLTALGASAVAMGGLRIAKHPWGTTTPTA